jgi:hypothetical protein
MKARQAAHAGSFCLSASEIFMTRPPNAPDGFRLVIGPASLIARRMNALLVAAALRGPVRLILCARYLDLSSITYQLARQAPEHYQEILDQNLKLARAETCYQVAELLPKLEVSASPTLISSLLSGFYDQGVNEREVDALLFETIQALRRLSKAGPVVVSSAPDEQRARLFKALRQAAAQIEQPQAAALQAKG